MSPSDPAQFCDPVRLTPSPSRIGVFGYRSAEAGAGRCVAATWVVTLAQRGQGNSPFQNKTPTPKRRGQLSGNRNASRRAGEPAADNAGPPDSFGTRPHRFRTL